MHVGIAEFYYQRTPSHLLLYLLGGRLVFPVAILRLIMSHLTHSFFLAGEKEGDWVASIA